MIIDQQKIIQLIRNKLAVYYNETGKTVSFDVASKAIGISKPTLSRVLQGKVFAISTWLLICKWLDSTPNDFIKQSPQ